MLNVILISLGKTVLIQPAEKRFTEELKTKRENSIVTHDLLITACTGGKKPLIIYNSCSVFLTVGKSSDSSACQDSLCFPDNSLIAHKDESSSAQSVSIATVCSGKNNT